MSKDEAGQCTVFVATDEGTVAATLSTDSTVAELEENIEQTLGIPGCDQYLMRKQKKLSDKEPLFDSETEQGQGGVSLLHPLAGGGDSGIFHLETTGKKTWRQSVKEDLLLFVTEVFPDDEDQETYGQLLLDKGIISLAKLQRMDKECLCRIGFTEIDAELVLSNCSLRTIAVWLEDSRIVLGNIRVHLCARLTYVKKLIVKDRLCKSDLPIVFLHGDVLSPVTAEQETTWALQDAIRETEAGKTIFVTQTKQDDPQLVASSHSGSYDASKRSTLEVGSKDTTVGSCRDSLPKEKSRLFDELGSHHTYRLNHVLEAESQWREYKSLSNTPKGMIPLKVIDYGRKFVTGCLNRRDQGVIAFGIGDTHQGFYQGQIIGIDVSGRGQQDRLSEAFQYMLDNLIHRFESPKNPLSLMEQRCISLHFIRVVCETTSSMKLSEDLHVVEIQVLPEWGSLKDNVYVCARLVKKNTEKDMSSDVPDDWKFREDYKIDGKDPQVYIRESTRTRHVETVTELLSLYDGMKTLYQEKMRSMEKQQEADASENYSELGGKLRRSLKGIDYSRFQYLLVANSVPPELRDTTELDFVMDVLWNAVFDLDAASKSDGLFTVMKRITESVVEQRNQPERISQSCYRVGDAYALRESDVSLGTNNFPRTDKQTWIFSSGMTSVDTYDKWVKRYKKPVEDIIKEYYDTGKMPVFLFLLLSDTALEQIVDMIKTLLGYRPGQNSVVVLSKDRKIAKQLCDMSRVNIRDCCISGLPWNHIRDNISHMTGGLELVSGKTITSSSGTVMQVPPKMLREWPDIELVGYNECESILESDSAAVEAREQFYKGGLAQWLNFKHNHAIVREKAEYLEGDIQGQIDKLILKGDPNGQHRMRREHGLRLRVVELQHEPGTGGTTISRHMLWKFRQKCRCALVTSLDKQSVLQIGQLYEYGEVGTDGPLLPVLLLVDQVDDQQFEVFCEALDKAPSRVKAVILRCRPTLFDFQCSMTSQGESPPIKLPSRLSKKESVQVKGILKKLGKQHDDIDGDEKQILYLGLKLFGNEFRPDLLARFVGNHLDRVSAIERDMLLFCSLVYTYMHKAIPVAFTQSLISPLERFIPYLNQATISDRTADLLLVVQDSVRDHHSGVDRPYRGYRPAHYLVGQQVLAMVRMSLVKAAERFVDKMLAGTFSYASKIRMCLTVNLFLERDTTADFDVDDETVSGDLDPLEEPHKGTQKQRYSPLIMDLLADDARCDALRLLIDLCQKTRKSPHAAFVWQLIARFLTYEFAEEDLPEQLGVTFSGILKDENLCLRGGYNFAVAAIDSSIELMPDRSIFHTTRGQVYQRQLTPFKKKICSPDDLIRVVHLTQIACKAFYKARQCATTFFNWYPLIGEIEVCLDLLKLFKEIIGNEQGCRDSTFRSFLESKLQPKCLNDLDEGDISFVRSSEQRIANNLDELFEREHFNKGDTRFHRRERYRAPLRGASLQADFILVCEIEFIEKPKSLPGQPESNLELRRRLADLVLQKKREQPFSTWAELEKSDLQQIAELLCPCVVVGRPAVRVDATVVMLVRACIELKGSSPLTVSDLVSLVNRWCITNPSSKWAHFFQSVFYFPRPSPICPPDKEIVKNAVTLCQSVIQQHMKQSHLPRRSRPLYFAGTGDNLSALVPPHKVSFGYNNSNDFWRSRNVRTKLLRLEGEKVKAGRILYKGIEIIFDDNLYPNESHDTLHFYLGFTIQGPYAYDPVTQSTLESFSAPSAPSKAQKVIRRGGSKNTNGNGKSTVSKVAAGNQYNTFRDFPKAYPSGEITAAKGSDNLETKDRPRTAQYWQPDKEQFPELTRREGATSTSRTGWQIQQTEQPVSRQEHSRTTDSTVPSLPPLPSGTSSPSLTEKSHGKRSQLEQPTCPPDSSTTSLATMYQSQPSSSKFSGADLQREPRSPTFGTDRTAKENSVASREYMKESVVRKTAHPGESNVAEGIRSFPTRPPSAEATKLACHSPKPSEQQLLEGEESICRVVESVSSERDASVAAAKISSVLQCEQHCKVLAEVILKQCQIYAEEIGKFCDCLGTKLKKNKTQIDWFVGALRDYCTRKVVEVTSGPNFNPRSYGSFIHFLIQRQVLNGSHVNQIITTLMGKDVQSLDACVCILSELGPSVYNLLSTVSEVDSFIKKLAKEDRVRRLPAELHRRLQTLVKNHRGYMDNK